jgi:hypothetical protein
VGQDLGEFPFSMSEEISTNCVDAECFGTARVLAIADSRLNTAR